MTRSELQRSILDLPREDRLELIRAVWESLSAEGPLPVSPQELALIDERIREHEANPRAGVPWEDVKGRLWPNL